MKEAGETIEAGGLVFELRRSTRRRTLGLTIDRGGALVARAPEGVPTEEVRRFAESRLLWVHQKLAEKSVLQPWARGPEFVTGETIFYTGRSVPLRVVKGLGRDLEFDGSRFFLDAAADPGRAFRRWFKEAGRELIPRRVRWFAKRTTKLAGKVSVRDLGYRWGSCSSAGNLNFHWQLVQLPLRLIDYVVAHELAHLSAPDHSPAFWKALEEILPDCRQRQGELEREARHYLQFSALE